MSYPIAELITQDVYDTLTRVNTIASFNTTLTVERFRRCGQNTVDDMVAVVCFGDDQLVPDGDTAEGFTYWIRPYGIMVYIFEPDNSEMPYDQRLDIVLADITKAVMEDTSRGNYAFNTWMRDPVRFDNPNDNTGVFVRFDVLYGTAEGDPYRKAPVAP